LLRTFVQAACSEIAASSDIRAQPMQWFVRSACLLAVTFAPVAPRADARPTDDDIRAAIIGSWIVPRDSPDYGGVEAHEVFLADGTYTITVFYDRACRLVAHVEKIKWTVKDGILTSTSANGDTLRDEVVGIDSHLMTRHSLDDDTTFTREKSEACSSD
jgi:hypothetical protein